MSWWIAIILGIVQGLTEFLPVSSSGHLVLLENIFGIENNVILFDIVLHLATVFAVIFVYKKTILEIIKNPFGEKSQKILFASLPTFIIALMFKSFFENSFNGNLLVIGFTVTAVFLIITQVVSEKEYQYRKLSSGNAIVIGVFQGFALMPGISRSGSTITSAIVQGVKRDEAAEFSFLLSVPVILGSLFFELLKLKSMVINIPAYSFVVGFFFALLSGIFAIKVMLKVIKKAKYYGFAIYLILLSIFLLLNQFVLKLF